MNKTYPDDKNFTFPDCSHEWSAEEKLYEIEEKRVHKDAQGYILNDGEAVILIKDLKVKGSSLVINGGTKIKNIRLIDDDHDVDCKVDGQNMLLKSEFMKKV